MELKTNLLKEQILIKDDIISEAKRIGIDKLPFGFRSISSFIDGKTMDVHYNKHYKGYVEKLNKALSKKNYGDVELENIIQNISRYNKTIRNNAGGAFNHALFWKMLSPTKQEIPTKLKQKINKEFGSYNNFKKEFTEIAKDRFGSGWAWLVMTKNNRLKILSTPNQDNPLMNIINGGGFPILGLDVWEHAYYLKYQNKRDEYIDNFWDVINWDFVYELYKNKLKKNVNETILDRQISRILLEQDGGDDLLEKLCADKSTLRNYHLTYCKLLSYRNSLKNPLEQKELDDMFLILFKFYGRRTSQGLVTILLSALSQFNVISAMDFLRIITKVISSEKYQKLKLKQKLENAKSDELVGDEFAEYLRGIQTSAAAKYEASLVGDEFSAQPTKLSLPYSCDKSDVYDIFSLLIDFESGSKQYNTYLNKIKNCLENELNTTTPPLKADVLSPNPLYYVDENGNKVEAFPSNTSFEVKKMDVGKDSYLSEFFSIFKNITDKPTKTRYMDRYNHLIHDLFIFCNDAGQQYLDNIKNQIGGLIFDDYLIVPKEYVEFYWSNKGQRGCDELRLSIRFRILPDKNNKFVTYEYRKGSNILVREEKTLSDKLRKKYVGLVTCPAPSRINY